jgi:hypothetical protein
LDQVIFNLIQNAIDAMGTTSPEYGAQIVKKDWEEALTMTALEPHEDLFNYHAAKRGVLNTSAAAKFSCAGSSEALIR